MSRYMQVLACRFHPTSELIEDYRAGDMICSQCGLVVGERMIDVSSEWRDFGDESNSKDRSRVGSAQSLLYDYDNFLTTISIGTSAGARNELGKQKYRQMTSQTSSADKALRNGHDAIRAMAAHIHLTKKIIDRAFLIYKHCYEKKCLRGYSPEAIIASCIYSACRQEGSPRTMKEICGVAKISVKDLGRCFNKIKLSLPDSSVIQSIDIKDLVPRFCNQLELKQEILIRKTAMHIVERANEICDIQGRAPSSVASAAIYMACLAACEKITKEDIQKPTGVSEGVIRDVYRLMLPQAAKLFPTDFVFKCSIVNLPML
ncbi:unnamed protein product [Rotaria sp. Silwood1]|nr:unnamed protein product [Rotaria sp. Silwood1]CAF1109744.1 unnamed protein product [Rotaria sp. Silwood1]CAF3398728.1 unnamed protein product [Rotaria sp. Silwood1]CAF3666751.1 unnamed protein product [Rotaria sp. Silwood1]CAF3672524.1 unnamed protein product [Rotaria sp. Silwood1]